MDHSLLSFVHSLLRYGVLIGVLLAFLFNLRGWLMGRPILTGERMITIVAMVLCHVQLVFGVILYLQNIGPISRMEELHQRFWKYEHPTAMILAVALVTVGRVLSKKANSEPIKQRHIAIFYGIGLLLMLWATPWPFTEVGHAFGWL